MKNILSVLLILLATSGFGQKLKKIKQKVTEGHTEYEEVFYVLKEDKNTRQGEYTKKSEYRGVVEKGYYKNGVKDSLWTYYRDEKKNLLKAQGHFSNNEKVGAWNFYDWSGNLIQIFDYSLDSLLFDKDAKNRYEFTCNTKKDSADSCLYPVIIGGYTVTQEIIAKNLVYPPLAVENGVQGTVYIKFEIDINGIGKNPTIYKGVSPDIDAEALRTMRIILDEIRWYTWGKNTTYKITMPIKFKLG